MDLDVGGGIVLKTRTLNRKNEALVYGVHYRQRRQTLEEKRMDACCGCVARWRMKLCDTIGSCLPGWIFVEKEKRDAQ